MRNVPLRQSLAPKPWNRIIRYKCINAVGIIEYWYTLIISVNQSKTISNHIQALSLKLKKSRNSRTYLRSVVSINEYKSVSNIVRLLIIENAEKCNGEIIWNIVIWGWSAIMIIAKNHHIEARVAAASNEMLASNASNYEAASIMKKLKTINIEKKCLSISVHMPTRCGKYNGALCRRKALSAVMVRNAARLNMNAHCIGDK